MLEAMLAMRSVKRTIGASVVLGAPVDLAVRKRQYSATSAIGALRILAEMQAAVDGTPIEGGKQAAELRWLDSVAGEAAARTAAIVRSSGGMVFAPRAMVQCLREVIMYGGSDSHPTSTPDEIVRCVLGVNEEHDSIGGQSAVEVLNSLPSATQEAIDALRDESMVDEVASRSFEQQYFLPGLVAPTHDLWRRKWCGGPVSDFGESPSALFTRTFDVEFDSVLAAGLLVAELAERGVVEYSVEELIGHGMAPAAARFVDDYLTTDLAALKKILETENAKTPATGWLRYTLRRFPFIRVGEGRLLLMRMQFGVERFFGEMLYWELWAKLGGPKGLAAEHFSQGIDNILEARVGEILRRIVSTAAVQEAIVIHEKPLETYMRPSGTTERVSSCDWVLQENNTCLVIDVNNRQLHQPFAERKESVDKFYESLENNLVEHKFVQIAATIKRLRELGGLPDAPPFDDDTEFVPIVIVPDTGLPFTELVDREIVRRSKTVLGVFGDRVLPPAVLTLSDMHLLHGLAEYHGKRGNPVQILANWRRIVANEPLPITLQTYLDLSELDRPVNSRFAALHVRLQKQLNAHRL